MHWTEPASADDSHADLEKRLWDAANQLWANADLKSSEFSPIVLGLIFLRYAETRFAAVAEEIQPTVGSRRKIGPKDYHAKGVLYLPEEARFPHLLQLPEGSAMGKAVNDAMRAVEKENPDLADVLPKTFQVLENRTLAELLKVMASIPMDKEGDTFGLIYEYFLGKFAMSEGQKGGEFYTPTSIVRLIVDILEPYHGRIYDPACGSGGMFIQSARFVEAHRANRTLTPALSQGERGKDGKYSGDPTKEISCHGQERVTDTSRLARLNLAVHGLSGDIRQGNTYYEDLHDSVGRFDFVLANPPFNVSKIDKERIADDPRYKFGLPRTDNGNYLWIQHFHSALKPSTGSGQGGRAGFVMANSAADARASEQDIREKLISSGDVDVMVSIGPNFFFTVTLPCTLWFFDKAKSALPPSPPAPLPEGEGSKKGKKGSSPSGRGGGEGAADYDYSKHVGARYRDTVLFIDARHIFRQIDRAHRDFTPVQHEFLANVVRLYRGQEPEFQHGSEEKLREIFSAPQPSPQPSPTGRGSKKLTSTSKLPSTSGRGAGGEGSPGTFAYSDVPGLCKAATRAEIEAQGWSLNPGRYVGVAKGEDLSDEDFKEQLEALNEELEVLNAEARELEERIAEKRRGNFGNGMTATFSRIPVSELVSSGEVELKTGPFGTQLKASDYVDDGIPVINVRNIGFGTIRPDKLEYITNETRDRLSGHVLRPDDIVFGRKGAVERHVFIRKEQDGWFQGADCLRRRLKSSRIHPEFASYYFLTEAHQAGMKGQCSHGATMASLNQGILERIELPVPSLATQRRIAGILSAYDDLIENNLRRIFDWLHEQKDAIESDFGASLEWLRMEDKKASGIRFRKDFDGYNPESWPEMIEWLTNHVKRLEKAFAPRLAKLGKKLKSEKSKEAAKSDLNVLPELESD